MNQKESDFRVSKYPRTENTLLLTQDSGIILPSSYDTYSELQNKACPGLLELSMSHPFWQIGSILTDLSVGRNMPRNGENGIALFESPVM